METGGDIAFGSSSLPKKYAVKRVSFAKLL
jgi:hypothetical protein